MIHFAIWILDQNSFLLFIPNNVVKNSGSLIVLRLFTFGHIHSSYPLISCKCITFSDPLTKLPELLFNLTFSFFLFILYLPR
jgi:hypothetical protein